LVWHGFVMCLPSGDRVVALEPETGTYWPGDRSNPPRIIFTTARKMMALNARTQSA
jgi:hypothetical protein